TQCLHRSFLKPEGSSRILFCSPCNIMFLLICDSPGLRSGRFAARGDGAVRVSLPYSKGTVELGPVMEFLSKRPQIGDSLIDYFDLIQKNAPRVLRRARTSKELCQPGADLREREAEGLRRTHVEHLLQHFVGKLSIPVSRPP